MSESRATSGGLRLLGIPLHPFLVHFPIALLAISLVMDIASYFGIGNAALVQGSLYMIVAGVGTGLLAAIFGFVDYAAIRRDHPSRGIAQWHMGLNVLVIATYGIELIVRFRERGLTKTDVAMTATSLVAMLVLGVSGYLGGMMVYEDGTKVGRHRRRGITPTRTLSLVSAGSTDGFVHIPGAELMKEGQTLRLDIDGRVISLLRLGDEFYAFQEFCTHRFGPLSEGSFADGQVMCPWHKSCFDLRTGRVTKGPADADIYVYQIRRDARGVSVRVPPHPDSPHESATQDQHAVSHA